MPDEDVVTALADHARPLASTDPAAPRADAAPLAALLDGADVVGLGEPTHGTRELFALKRRLVRHLVADRGFRTVALEADVAATAAVDGYVRRGDGDPAGALAGLHVWPWKVAELVGLLEWLRSFNEGRADGVRVVGLSPNDAARPAERLRASPTSIPREAEAALAAAASGDLPDDPDRLARFRAAVDDLADRLDGDPDARLRRRAVAQALTWHRTRSRHDGPHEGGMAHRDRLMADNVERALDRDPGDGVAVWAHDSHVKRGRFDDGTVWTDAATMGEHLDAALGERYRVLGGDVGRGRVRALAAGTDGPTDTFALGEPRPGSATAHLDALGAAPAVVDLAAAGEDDRLAGWFADCPPKRWVGSVYDPDAAPGHHYMRTDLPASFDALYYLPTSTPTRPLDRA